MEEDEDDDIYAPVEASGRSGAFQDAAETLNGSKNGVSKDAKSGEDLEDGEEEGEEVEEEESDSDIDIITEQKEDTKIEPIHNQRLSAVKGSRARTPSTEPGPKLQAPPAVKRESASRITPPISGASFPAVKTSNIDVDAKPIYEPAGKPITEVDMDVDFAEDKPWRRPGTDITDYFNYGFDEFTWADYCIKQNSLRKEVTDSKKALEDMQKMLSMPSGMPAMPGSTGGGQFSVPSAPGVGDVPPEMQQMFTQMMASGMDPSMMDPTMMMQMMQGGQGGATGGQGQAAGGTGQGFGSQGQNQQQMGYGYGGGGRNQGGRGQGRRNW